MRRCPLVEGARGWLSDLPCSGDKSLCCSALRPEAAGCAGGRQQSVVPRGRPAPLTPTPTLHGAAGEAGAPEPHPVALRGRPAPLTPPWGCWRGEAGAPDPHPHPALSQTSTSAAATPGASAATGARTRLAPTSAAAPPASGSQPTAGPARVSGGGQAAESLAFSDEIG